MIKIVYVSCDLECVSDKPEDFGIINVGLTAYTEDRIKLGDLSVNMIPGKADENTVKWWNSTPELQETYKKCTEGAIEPLGGMLMIRDWFICILEGGGKKPVMVNYPTIYDGSIMYHYWFTFLGRSSGGLRCPLFDTIDIRSYGAGKLGITYLESSPLPRSTWRAIPPHRTRYRERPVLRNCGHGIR